MSCSGGAHFTCLDLRSTQGYVGVAFADPPAGTQPHTASLVLRDAAGAVLLRSSQELRLVKSAPNGEQCGPVCWSGTAVFGGSG